MYGIFRNTKLCKNQIYTVIFENLIFQEKTQMFSLSCFLTINLQFIKMMSEISVQTFHVLWKDLVTLLTR